MMSTQESHAELIVEELKMCTKPNLQVPVVDLSGMEVEGERKKIVDEIREASEKWGMFQVINHGIPSSVLEGMLHGAHKFHEQDGELKKEYYSSDLTRRVRYESNLDYPAYQSNTKTSDWRETFYISWLVSGHVDEPEEIPAVCRKTSVEYLNHVVKLGETIFEILSEALGLKPNHLNAMECAKRQSMVFHYYPACPQPETTIGTATHTDPVFLVILLQDINGLQVMHNSQWVDVEPVEGGLVVNIGDFLQMISNDKFVSPPHRALANNVESRTSVGCFFNGIGAVPKVYGPIEELTSEEKPPVYKEFLPADYLSKFLSGSPDKTSYLDLFRL